MTDEEQPEYLQTPLNKWRRTGIKSTNAMINTTLQAVSLLRMIPLALMVLFVIGTWSIISQAEPLDTTRIDKAVKVVKELCLSGTQFDLHADAKGNVTLKNLRKPGGEGSVSVNVRNSEGAAAIFDEKLRIMADDKVRECMRSELPRIIDAILGKAASAGTTVSQLPPGFSIDSKGFVVRPDGNRICKTEIIRHFRKGGSSVGGGSTLCKLYDGTWGSPFR
jgi:hypothetical protein